MHEKIKAVLDNALEVIKTTLDNDTEAIKEVLQTLMLIKIDLSDAKGYQYFQDVYPKIEKKVDLPEDNFDWHDAIGDIGSLLGQNHPLYGGIDTEAASEADEVYGHLVGITEEIVVE